VVEGGDSKAADCAARHLIAQWEAHATELARDQTPDGRGRYSIPRDGLVSAFITLAYDLYVVRDNIKFHEAPSKGFDVATISLVCGTSSLSRQLSCGRFQVEPEDESDGSSKHAEFAITDRRRSSPWRLKRHLVIGRAAR